MSYRYRTLTTAAVLLVAGIAAVESYMHVASLALRYGQPAVAAYLLPVSIDGLVAVASLVMLRSARLGVSAPWLARTGLVLAVVATLRDVLTPGPDLAGGRSRAAAWLTSQPLRTRRESPRRIPRPPGTTGPGRDPRPADLRGRARDRHRHETRTGGPVAWTGKHWGATATGGSDHLAERCRDEYCPRLPCRLYKAGKRDGFDEGYELGWLAGYAAGAAAAGGG